MDSRPRIQPWMNRPRSSHSRSSSWDSHIDDSVSPISDNESRSCFTAESTMNSSTLSSLGFSTTGTIPMTLGFAPSPVSPESATSSLAAIAWPPLDLRNGGRTGESSAPPPPPLPAFKEQFANFPPRQQITLPPGVKKFNQVITQTCTIEYSASTKSQYPEISERTPSDVGPSRPLPYGNQLHVQSRTDLRLPADDKPFHTDITPGQSQPLQLPDSPALESYYKAPTTNTNTTTNTKVTIVSGPQIIIPAARTDLNSPAFSFEQTPKATPHNSTYAGASTGAHHHPSHISIRSNSRRSSVSSLSDIDVDDDNVEDEDSDEESVAAEVARSHIAPPAVPAAQLAAQAATASSSTQPAGPSYSGFNFNTSQSSAFQHGKASGAGPTLRHDQHPAFSTPGPAPRHENPTVVPVVIGTASAANALPKASSAPKATKPIPAPIVLMSPPQLTEWHPPPQTPMRSLSLAHRPIDPVTLQSLPNSSRTTPAASAGWSPQPQTSPPTQNSNSPPSHGRSDSSSSTTRLITGRTRSFSSGQKPSPFKLNPGNQQFPAPPSTGGSSTASPFKLPTSKFSDDGDNSKKQSKAAKSNQWTVHFTTPLTLSILFFCGLISAALHHIYYSQLNNTDPGKMQRWHTSAGIAISMFTIACWIACVAICYRQRVWSTLSKTDVKITGIDALWGLLQDPSLFLVGEAWRKSRVAMMLGVIVWVLPLTILLVPGSLIVGPQMQEHDAACIVPSFNPPTEDQAKLLASEPLAKILERKPVKTLNMMVNSSKTAVLSNESKRLLTISSFSGDIVDYSIPEACAEEGECSYSLSFTAPGYKCDTKTKDEVLRRGPWLAGDLDKLLAIKSERVYFYSGKASTTVQSGGLNDTRTGFGSFWSFVRTIKPDALIANRNLLRNPGAIAEGDTQTQFFQCVDYLVQYDNVRFEYRKSQMSVVLPQTESRGMTFRTPVDYTQINRDRSSPDGSSTLFNRVAHEYTMSMLLRDTFIQGANTNTPTLVRLGQTEALRVMDETTLYGQENDSPNGIQERFTLPSINMRSLVEDVHRNNTFSLLSEARFRESYYIPTQCTYKAQGVKYEYDEFSLMLAYGVACFLTTVGLLVGIVALCTNGFVADFTFSRVLCTTRNPTLDDLCRGESCMGTASESVGHRRIRFGEVWVKGKKQHWTEPILSKIKNGLGIVQEESAEASEGVKNTNNNNTDVEDGQTKTLRVGHAAFGVHSEVVALKKGKAYA